ncbi:RHS repeat-associated core domain-containing protein [Corynebacterium macclintockiae]|uniref:RHS repeat-associated core domain-containing protein n=1 Tax=Corynebacterium macclintockiae TaxID=2913501 RepID=UPI003EBD6EBA
MVTGEHLTLPVAGTITTGYGRNAAGEITSSTITQHTTANTTDDSALRLPTGDADTGRLLAELTYTTNTRGHRATTAIDNLVRTIDIDTRGRITGDHTNLLDSTTTGGLVPVAGRDFTWQADSTLTAITDQLRGTTRFTVDAIGRATSATRTPHTNTSGQGTTPPHAPTHTPARAGTPAQSGSATTGGSAQENYSFTPAGVLASTTDGVIDYHNTLPVKVGRTTYTYDNAGRITRTVTKRLGKKPLVHHFFYATGEQPIGFTSSDEPNTGYRYTYDGLGRRVAKDTINTTTGKVTHRDVFTHTGNQLAAVTTTVDTTTPARVGEGYVWTTDPATGDTHGQIALTNGTSGTGDATQTPGNPAATWSQARVDATFYALVCDLAGAPQELINTTTGVIEGHTTQTLYGKRTWSGRCTSPLLFAGQYEDVESGWAYNRFRYYNPTLGAYNAQDPLGLAPRLASAQGYVDHAAYWVDVLGLQGASSHISEASKKVGLPQTVQGTTMKRYGSSPVGGHHIPAKANYNNAVNSAAHQRDAPAIPISELSNSNNPATGNLLHREITAAQQSKYNKFASTFNPEKDVYTWDQVREIEIEAHKSVGFSTETAQAYVDFGVDQLKAQGVTNPTNIPWNPGLI